MRAPRGLIQLLLVVALLWQGDAGALAAGRFSALAVGTPGGLTRVGLCRLVADDPSPPTPEADPLRALCASHCGAVVAAGPPPPLSVPSRIAFRVVRFEPVAVSSPAPASPLRRRFARGPPTLV